MCIRIPQCFVEFLQFTLFFILRYLPYPLLSSFSVLVRLHGTMPRRDDSRCGGGSRERRRDTPPTPTAPAATEPRAGTGATKWPRVRRCDESESESEPAEVAALARFRQTERCRQDPDTEKVSKPREKLRIESLSEKKKRNVRSGGSYLFISSVSAMPRCSTRTSGTRKTSE